MSRVDRRSCSASEHVLDERGRVTAVTRVHLESEARIGVPGETSDGRRCTRRARSGSVGYSLDEPIGDRDRQKASCFEELLPLALVALPAVDERKHDEVDHFRGVR